MLKIVDGCECHDFILIGTSSYNLYYSIMKSFEHRKQNYLRRSFHNCSGIRVVWTLVFFLEFVDRCLSFFIFFILVIWCSVLPRLTDYDCPFGIFKLFLHTYRVGKPLVFNNMFSYTMTLSYIGRRYCSTMGKQTSNLSLATDFIT